MHFPPRKKLQVNHHVCYAFASAGRFSLGKTEFVLRLSFVLGLVAPSTAEKVLAEAVKMKLISQEGTDVVASQAVREQVSAWLEHTSLKLAGLTPHALADGGGGETKARTSFKEMIDELDPGKSLLLGLKIRDTEVDLRVVSRAPCRILASFSGEHPTVVKIDEKAGAIEHDCPEWTKLAPNKKFCAHVMKTFLLLRKRDQQLTHELLKNLTTKLERWSFRQISK
ncbi:MAG: hypothetical protein Kow0069_34460 [Promethearchaeota archaeon]